MQSNVRVVGSNYSVFRWRGKPIAYLESIQDGGVRPVAMPEAIFPLGQNRPTEFVTARAHNAGTLSLTIRELWDKPVWQHLEGLATAQNIIDVWDLIARDPSVITCQTVIVPPQGNYLRVKTYHNVIVAEIDDSETVSIAAMSIARGVQCYYTHATRTIINR